MEDRFLIQTINKITVRVSLHVQRQYSSENQPLWALVVGERLWPTFSAFGLSRGIELVTKENSVLLQKYGPLVRSSRDLFISLTTPHPQL